MVEFLKIFGLLLLMGIPSVIVTGICILLLGYFGLVDGYPWKKFPWPFK